MDWTDQEAAARARSGDHNAFRLLVERHSHSLFKLAFRLTNNEQDAEDLVQETFLRAYRQLARFRGNSAFSTWLFRICVNCSLDLLRTRKQRAERQPLCFDSDSSDTWLSQVPAAEPSAERLVQSHQIAELLQPALAQLSETERSAFLLRHHEGFAIPQIAQVLGVRAGAAKHSVFRAVQKLRRALQSVAESGIR